MRRVLFSFFLLLSSLVIHAQKDVTFITQELNNLEVKLIKKGESLKLTHQQIDLLTKVYEDKGTRIANIKSKNMDKDAVSVALLKLEEEFAPSVAAILSKEQRMALQSIKTKRK